MAADFFIDDLGNRERIFDFIAYTEDGVFPVDRQKTIVLRNKAATAILGMTAGKVINRKCEEILQGSNPHVCAGTTKKRK